MCFIKRLFRESPGVVIMETLLILPLHLVLFAGVILLGEMTIARMGLPVYTQASAWLAIPDRGGISDTALRRMLFPMAGSSSKKEPGKLVMTSDGKDTTTARWWGEHRRQGAAVILPDEGIRGIFQYLRGVFTADDIPAYRRVALDEEYAFATERMVIFRSDRGYWRRKAALGQELCSEKQPAWAEIFTEKIYGQPLEKGRWNILQGASSVPRYQRENNGDAYRNILYKQ